MTKEEIFDKLKAVLSKEFEIEEDKITPAAKLPGKVDPAIFKTVKTMQDVVDALYPYTQQA